MTPIELQARREALGLSQSLLAAVLDVKQATISRWESGDRGIPEFAESRIVDMENAVESLIERMLALATEHGADVLIVHGDDAAFWRAHPEMDGWPAALQRVAAARALVEARDEARFLSIMSA